MEKSIVKKTFSILAAVILALLTACQPRTAPPATLLYLGWDDAERLQLFVYSERLRQTRQLTFSELGVAEYAISPDKRQVVYTTALSNTVVSHLRLLTLDRRNRVRSDSEIGACSVHCTNVQWSLDGTRLLFEQRSYRPNSTALGAAALHWLNVSSGETAPVIPTETKPHLASSLSPQGAWVAYSVSSEKRLYAYNFENGRFYTTGNIIGSTAMWHPDGSGFVMSDLDPVTLHGSEGDDHTEHTHEYEEAIHLFWVNPTTEQRSSLTEAPGIDDGAALFSPDGAQLLFGRKPIRTSTGRQLYVMTWESKEIRRLTNDLNTHYGAASWSGDGRFLLYQAVNTRQANLRPSIWRMNVASGETVQLVAEGVLPSWLE